MSDIVKWSSGESSVGKTIYFCMAWSLLLIHPVIHSSHRKIYKNMHIIIWEDAEVVVKFQKKLWDGGKWWKMHLFIVHTIHMQPKSLLKLAQQSFSWPKLLWDWKIYLTCSFMLVNRIGQQSYGSVLSSLTSTYCTLGQ